MKWINLPKATQLARSLGHSSQGLSTSKSSLCRLHYANWIRTNLSQLEPLCLFYKTIWEGALDPCYSECGLRTNSTSSLGCVWKRLNLRPYPKQVNQNQNFNKSLKMCQWPLMSIKQSGDVTFVQHILQTPTNLLGNIASIEQMRS